MNHSISDDELLEGAEEIGRVTHLKNIPRGKQKGKASSRKTIPAPRSLPLETGLADQSDSKFEITYKAARHEAVWLEDSLSGFMDQKWFDDVLRMVKGGKEASVYLCAGNPTTGLDFLAAKVYRPRRFRNLKNDWLYKEGRANLDSSGNRITNEGMLNAIRRRTEFGRELMHTSWLEHEFMVLKTLSAAGADVPRPLASGNNAILMEYVGDEAMNAPTLNEVDLSTREARALFERVIYNIDLMLAQGLIHADLSAYNILYWEGDIVLIDFPQAIRPEENNSASQIFTRDVIRVCEYFERHGVPTQARRLAESIWNRHHQPTLPSIDPKILREDNNDERDIWETLKNR